MIELPDVITLRRRTQALAALDLILSPEWEYRHYSFNAAWSQTEQLASMRNGSGDEWYLLFQQSGAAGLKGVGHESLAWSMCGTELAATLQASVPVELKNFATEPAFNWIYTSFCYYCLSNSNKWHRSNDATRFWEFETGEDELLNHIVGDADDYLLFARDYFERDIPTETVKKIFAHEAITEWMIADLNPGISLAEISDELTIDVGYPVKITT